MTQPNLDEILKQAQAMHPGKKIRIAESLPVDRLAPAKNGNRGHKDQPEPRIVSVIKWFRKPEDKGVGDTVERLLANVGGRVAKRFLKRLKIQCGCGTRQAKLNRRYPY